MKEVDILGQTLPSGINITSENDENGNITFATIKYFESSVHFYKISEINENEANVEYDDKEYILMVQVGEYNNSYLIEKAVILYNDEILMKLLKIDD